MDRRLIDPSSIPVPVVSAIAKALGRSASAVVSYSQLQPTFGSGTQHRANQEPSLPAVQEDFFDAVHKDLALDEEARNALLALSQPSGVSGDHAIGEGRVATSHAGDLRAAAREHAARLRKLTGGDVRAEAILSAAERDTGVRRVPVPAGDPLLDGGDAVYDPEVGRIWYNHEIETELAAMYQAHEYAHLWLGHAGRTACDADNLDPDAPDEPMPLGVHRVEGYGPKERRERDANVFGRELLLPTDLVRTWFIEEELTAAEIGARVGVPVEVVYHQVAYAVLVGDLPRATQRLARPQDIAPVASHSRGTVSLLESLDPSQREAACVERGPVLVEAGPGTGKTRTLVGRVLHLLSRGEDPRRILALTFSNKAAEEMRERIAHAAPDAASLMWIGTFHALGLDLLRKYGTRVGLPTDPRVVDPNDAMFLLERELPSLALKYYQYLPEPTRALEPILAAISRAKDELRSPADYYGSALAMRDAARDAVATEAAEKALEVARVYEIYQVMLEREGALDFGDLIGRAVAIMELADTGVASAVRNTFAHVLVDEYQDVNRASAVLLKLIVDDGEGLWVVGDARQSIYRFRGAAPANMRRFATDFPGARMVALARNYRSQATIVRALNTFAAGMPALPGSPFRSWEAERPTTNGAVYVHIAADAAAEGAGIAAEIIRHRDGGLQFREQAILCRSHTQLARVGVHLEAAGIPVLYLGDIFERSEVRDMLALLSLACQRDGHSLLRVARFPEYAIPFADVREAIRLASEQNVAFPEALAHVVRMSDEQSPLSPEGRRGLAMLAGHLDSICHGKEPWPMLSRYLFDRSEYVRRVARDTSLPSQQQRLAIYQFLQFTREQGSRGGQHQRVWPGEDPKRSFLRFVRRLAMLGDDTRLRQVPEWAAGIDAVRLMTVHASKGLEFPAVFVPALGSGIFPATPQWNACPAPPDLLSAPGDGKAEHEQEECLFFVAISRAQDTLHLSRALTYAKSGRASNASRLLSRLDPVLQCPSSSHQITWPSVVSDDSAAIRKPLFETRLPDTYTARSLDTYLRCPRRYFYEEILGLVSVPDGSAYLEMHRCVHQVLRWIQSEVGSGGSIDLSEAARRLDDAWQASGPHGHAYESLYRAAADGLVTNGVAEALRRRGRGTESRPQWSIQLTHGTVTVSPDEVDIVREAGQTAVILRRLRTGRPTQSESEKPLYALYHAVAQATYPAEATRVEISYLSTRTVERVELKKATIASRVAKYDAAIEAIALGEFPAKPDDYGCPRCSHYFVCPMAEDS